MDERALQFRVGAMVVGTLLVAVLLLIVFNYSPSILRGRDTIYIKFAQAPGITQDTPIRKSGVLIGRVSEVTLRERDVLVTAKIDRDYTVYENEACRIGTESLLGGSMIEFVAYSPGDLGEPLTDGALVEGSLPGGARGTMEQASFAVDEVRLAAAEFRQFVAENRQQTALVMQKSQEAADQIALAAGDVSNVANKWNTLTTENEAQLARLITKSEMAMDSFQLAMNNINTLVGDEQMRADLQASLSGVPLLIEETRLAVSKYSAVADKADKSLTDAQEFTESLGELSDASGQMAANVDAITRKLDRLILDLLTMSDAINNQEGTLGLLIHDPEMYQRLNRAAGNVEQVSYRLRPIVEDVRVFTDKIARDPRQLGVRGAIERNPDRSKFFPFGGILRGGNTSQTQQYPWYQSAPPAFEGMPHMTPAYGSPTPTFIEPPVYQQSRNENGTLSSVQPASHVAPNADANRPQWSPTRPARPQVTSPQQFWRSR